MAVDLKDVSETLDSPGMHRSKIVNQGKYEATSVLIPNSNLGEIYHMAFKYVSHVAGHFENRKDRGYTLKKR